jgi:RHH-type proline utilization regulon transcriptional repressor/proline dehydrogenase/delta 1-pyrroline-5-carboxylate dehydrogenase
MAVRLLHEAGVPEHALQFLPGDGVIGATRVADKRVRGVMFTGSTEVAYLIGRQLAARLNLDGNPVPFIAETVGKMRSSSTLRQRHLLDHIACRPHPTNMLNDRFLRACGNDRTYVRRQLIRCSN